MGKVADFDLARVIKGYSPSNGNPNIGRELDNYTRARKSKKFLIAGAIAFTVGPLAGLFTISDFSETPNTKRLEEVVENEENKHIKSIGTIISGGNEILKSNPDLKDLNNAYTKFNDAADFAAAKYEQTKNPKFLAAQLVAEMHRGLTYLNAAFRMGEGSSDKSIYLKTAEKIYTKALDLRIELNRMGNPYPVMQEWGFMLVAKEETILDRRAQIYEALIKLEEGKKKSDHEKDLAKDYSRLVELTSGENKKYYQQRLAKISGP